jgi:hypothetical protein
MNLGKDGFSVREITTGKEIHFVSCAADHEGQRDRALMGLLRNMNSNRFYVVDTRDMA